MVGLNAMVGLRAHVMLQQGINRFMAHVIVMLTGHGGVQSAYTFDTAWQCPGWCKVSTASWGAGQVPCRSA